MHAWPWKMLLIDQTIHYVKLFTTQTDKITRKVKEILCPENDRRVTCSNPVLLVGRYSSERILNGWYKSAKRLCF